MLFRKQINQYCQWFAAVYTGLIAATYCCLLVNGFVGFQFAEDGTPLSLWVSPHRRCDHLLSHAKPQLLRLSCLTVFGVSFFVAIATFKSFASFSPTKPIALFVVYLIWPILCVAIYTLSQLVLVFRTLDDRWPLGDIIFGIAFYTIAQVLLFAFSVTICNAIKHYLDGLFFFTLCVLLSVMMVYKYWDSITVCRFRPYPSYSADTFFFLPTYSAKTSNSRSDPKLRFGKSKIRF